jgi:DNA repair protein REV1
MRKSVSCDVNFGVRLKTQQDLGRFLDDLCARVCKKLIDDSLIGSTLTMKIMVRKLLIISLNK